MMSVIHGCWLTTVIHYFSSEFEGRVSGVSVQVSGGRLQELKPEH